MTHSVVVVLLANIIAKLFEVFYYFLSSFISFHASIVACIFIKIALAIHDYKLTKIMARANFKVVRVVRWSDFYCTRTKVHFNILVGNDWNFFVAHYWNHYILTN